MKTYSLYFSNRSILIDEDDFKKFVEVAPSGNLIKLKGGIVNPNFVMCILPSKKKEEDKKDVRGYIDEKTRKFVVTEEITFDSPVVDEFGTTELALKKKI